MSRSTSSSGHVSRVLEHPAHSERVNCAAIGPTSGRVLATGSQDRSIQTWAVGNPSSISTLIGLTSGVECVSFDAREELVAGGSASGQLKVWDLERSKVVRTLVGHTSHCRTLSFHPFGNFFASGSLDASLRVWDLRRAGCIQTYKGHRGAVNCVAFSPDGRWIVSGGEDGLVKLWDLTAGRMLHEFQAHSSAVTGVCFHPDEYLLASGSADRTVCFYDLSEEPFALLGQTPPTTSAIRSLAFHGPGQALISTTQEGLKTWTWEPECGQCQESVSVAWGRVLDVHVGRHQAIAVTAQHQHATLSTWVADLDALRPFHTPSLAVAASHDQAPPPVHIDTHCSRPSTGRARPTSTATTTTTTTTSSDFEATYRVPPSQSKLKQVKPPSQHSSRSASQSPPVKQRPLTTRTTTTATTTATTTTSKRPPSHPTTASTTTATATTATTTHSRPKTTSTVTANPRRTSSSSSSRVSPTRTHPPSPSLPITTSTPTPRVPTPDTIIHALNTGHSSIASTLRSRLTTLKAVRSQFTRNHHRQAIETLLSLRDASAAADILNTLTTTESTAHRLWSLDSASSLLPLLHDLSDSSYEQHHITVCRTITVLCTTLGHIIRDTLSARPHSKPDIAMEERIEKCRLCKTHFLALKSSVQVWSSGKGEIGNCARKCLESYQILSDSNVNL